MDMLGEQWAKKIKFGSSHKAESTARQNCFGKRTKLCCFWISVMLFRLSFWNPNELLMNYATKNIGRTRPCFEQKWLWILAKTTYNDFHWWLTLPKEWGRLPNWLPAVAVNRKLIQLIHQCWHQQITFCYLWLDMPFRGNASVLSKVRKRVHD